MLAEAFAKHNALAREKCSTLQCNTMRQEQPVPLPHARRGFEKHIALARVRSAAPCSTMQRAKSSLCRCHMRAEAFEKYNALSSTKAPIPYTHVRTASNWIHQSVYQVREGGARSEIVAWVGSAMQLPLPIK